METDRELRTRILNTYGMWGAFCTMVLESKGAALDACADYVGLRRERYEIEAVA
jgi:hypothetical protein